MYFSLHDAGTRVYYAVMNLKIITSVLPAWYQKNARDLPWRKNISPYRTWISEIMLQQTRVESVIPYFLRFIQELPDVESLAAVPEEKLLKLWEGLGYYSRVKNLQKAAKVIVSRYNGVFPERYEEVITLPGIGEYTAGAICSIAFGQPVPAVDGNVLRVFCRITGSFENISLPATKKAVKASLQQIYPEKNPGDFTQGLMELGATVCLPNGTPLCSSCPMQEFCRAKKENLIAKIPVKTPPAARKIEQKTVLIISCSGKTALRKRPARGLLANLREFPNFDGFMTKKQVAALLQEYGFQVQQIKSHIRRKHIFTHLEWHMKSFSVTTSDMPPVFTWVSNKELLDNIPLPTAFKPLIKG